MVFLGVRMSVAGGSYIDVAKSYPDGGYGWVIAFGGFICNFMVDGTCYSYGLLLPHFKNEFGGGTSEAALAGSLCTGCYLLMGESFKRPQPPVTALIYSTVQNLQDFYKMQLSFTRFSKKQGSFTRFPWMIPEFSRFQKNFPACIHATCKKFMENRLRNEIDISDGKQLLTY